ncbi:MAG: M42 family metallopeptidase [Christensenellaceae bacterium]
MKEYTEFAVRSACDILAIDSPTGYTFEAADEVERRFAAMGYKTARTRKNGVIAELGGEGEPVVLAAHLDTLGAIVAEIKGDGRLRLSPLGGLTAANVETENCRIVTKFNGVYEGTIQLKNASIHVNPDFKTTERSFDTVEVVLDEPVSSKADVKALGISVGDIVCVEPRTRVTASGYIKSRFLDDKLSVGILLGFAHYLKQENAALKRKVYVLVTTYEEVGHGGSVIPADAVEAVSVDMGCVGDGLECTEKQVSVCAKDSGGPYDYSVVKGLIEAAKRAGADYAVDVYPMYGSDVEATLHAGYDIRHGLIGAGVYASHGYERSHRDGVENTLKLLIGYLVR